MKFVPLLLALFSHLAAAPVDESAVPPYTLDDPLLAGDGARITNAKGWEARRRPELLETMRREMYGADPGRPAKMRFEIFDRDPDALGGKATREQITVFFTGEATGPKMDPSRRPSGHRSGLESLPRLRGQTLG